jgi:two-component system nitrogen regulation response regulator GlnG
LTRQGYEVSRLETSQAAIDLVLHTTTPRIPDLLLSDVKMEGLDGLELTRQLLARVPLLPVVLFSVYDGKDLEAEAKRVGARLLLKKPFPLSTLARIISEVLKSPPTP